MNRIQPMVFTPSNNQTKITPHEAQTKFKTALKDAMNQVNEAQNASSKATEKLVNGNINDLHEVMIIGQKASISLQATVEIRNKVVEAYQEVMRMQV
ncbi:flagellar hook-basal body complex protein FliE [Anaerobacillus sp. MEB173]|uniref:flagellar hook-basal body complex protein FliE n=1 Tax=Anaerobacillus sp. MEB173 TaxID=3383345 RepID=UPI003F8F945A